MKKKRAMKSTLFDRLHRLLLDFFSSKKIDLTKETTFAVCFSGGGDSTALLLLMKDLRRRYDFLLKAVYVRHNLRSKEECNQEEAHVRTFCQNEQIELEVQTVPVAFIRQTAAEEKRSVEEVAREVRYRLFDSLHRQGFADFFLTAHHADDNYETVLMRFFQGSGISGLKGIPSRSGFVLRPLLTASSEDLHQFLKHQATDFFCDSSNLELSFLRNRYRHRIIPFLKQEIPGFESGFNRMIRKMEEADSASVAESVCLQPSADGVITLDRKQWESFNDAEKTQQLYSIFGILLPENERKRISFDFLSELKGNFGEKIYRGIRVRCSKKQILFSKPACDRFRTDFCLDVTSPGTYFFPGGKLTVTCSEKAAAADFSCSETVLSPPVFFRSLRFGDDRTPLIRAADGKETAVYACLGDRSGLWALFANRRRYRKRTADLEINRFFNYYICKD